MNPFGVDVDPRTSVREGAVAAERGSNRCKAVAAAVAVEVVPRQCYLARRGKK